MTVKRLGSFTMIHCRPVPVARHSAERSSLKMLVAGLARGRGRKEGDEQRGPEAGEREHDEGKGQMLPFGIGGAAILASVFNPAVQDANLRVFLCRRKENEGVEKKPASKVGRAREK